MIDSNFQKGCVLILEAAEALDHSVLKNLLNLMRKVAITYYKNEQAAIDIANEINADVKIYQLDNSNAKSVEETFKK